MKGRMGSEETVREWRSFVAVAEHGGFSRAAAALGISQPNLSRHIAALERRLGFQLFDRATRGAALTGPGADLLAPARDLLTRLETLHLHARKVSGGETGILRLGASSQTLVSFVAPMLGAFRRKHPGVDVRLGEGAADEIIAAVEAGRLEFGIVGGSIAAPLSAIPLYTAEMQLLVPAEDPRGALRRTDVRALDRQALLLLSRGSLSRRMFEAACHDAGVRPDIRLESESAQALVALVEQGYGAAVLPSTVHARSRRIRRVPVYAKGRKLLATMNLIWNPDFYHSRAAVLLFEEIKRFARHRGA
jgi:LysR family transcriptional regulator, cyn operon transcriptional activator